MRILFDALVVGDAEGAWERVVADVEAGTLRKADRGSGVPAATGFGNRGGDAAPTTTTGNELKMPVPLRELLTRTARHYVTTNAVQAGRGCPHGCRYCSV